MRNLKRINYFQLEESSEIIKVKELYADIIKYSDGKIKEDISGIHDIDKFCDEMEKVAKEMYRVFKKT